MVAELVMEHLRVLGPADDPLRKLEDC